MGRTSRRFRRARQRKSLKEQWRKWQHWRAGSHYWQATRLAARLEPGDVDHYFPMVYQYWHTRSYGVGQLSGAALWRGLDRLSQRSLLWLAAEEACISVARLRELWLQRTRRWPDPRRHRHRNALGIAC